MPNRKQENHTSFSGLMQTRFLAYGSKCRSKFSPTAQNLNRRRLYGRHPHRNRGVTRARVVENRSQDAAANLAIFSANFAPINLIIYASALLLFRWLFLINAFGQNFANQPTAPCGRGNFSFQSNCAFPSPIAHDGDSMTILKKAKSISFDE